MGRARRQNDRVECRGFPFCRLALAQIHGDRMRRGGIASRSGADVERAIMGPYGCSSDIEHAIRDEILERLMHLRRDAKAVRVPIGAKMAQTPAAACSREVLPDRLSLFVDTVEDDLPRQSAFRGFNDGAADAAG